MEIKEHNKYSDNEEQNNGYKTDKDERESYQYGVAEGTVPLRLGESVRPL